jgi:outer membrane protein OmpA-like peptidoglycan-associated protein
LSIAFLNANGEAARGAVYLVFFDWDKSNITPEGLQVIQLAVAEWKAGNGKIIVDGFTDGAALTPFNVKVSVQRAQTVAATLVKFGVSRGAILISDAYQRTGGQRVVTQFGVREPQNRRVEIRVSQG